MTEQQEEFYNKDNGIPFSKRINTFLELYSRYREIKLKFINEKIGKRERYNLLLEIETIKRTMNSMLPDYKPKQ